MRRYCVRGIVPGLIAMWLTSGCAFYQYRVWPNYDLLKAPDGTAESKSKDERKQVCTPVTGEPGTGQKASRETVPVLLAAAEQQNTPPVPLVPLKPKKSEYDEDWKYSYNSLCRALNMAGDLEGQYKSWGRTHERTLPIVLTALVPIAATIAGLGATGTAGAPVAALALTGGAVSAYGIGLSNAVREHIYAQGKVATRCLIDLYQPMLPGEMQYVKFRDIVDTDKLAVDKANLDKAIGTVQEKIVKLMSAEPQNSALVPAMELVDSARELSDSLKNLNTVSLRTEEFLRDPSRSLRQQIGELVKQINLALEETELDSGTLKTNLLAAISSTDLSNLAGAKSAANNAAAKAPPTNQKAGGMQNLLQQMGADVKRTPATPLDELNMAVDGLSNAVRTTQQDVLVVQAVVSGVGDNPNLRAKSCIDAQLAAAQTQPLKLDPSTVPTLSPGQQTTIYISGGTKPYSVKLLPGADKALGQSVKDVVPTQSELILTVQPDAKPATYALEITDGVQSSTRAVAVTVAPAISVTMVPPSATDGVKPGEKVTFIVRGGKGDYDVQTINAEKFFKVESPQQSGDGVTLVGITVDSGAKPGKYMVQIQDKNKVSAAMIMLTVKP
jgi:hypothetical protein